MADIVKKIGVLTSGGDAPGMNAAIRAVTRAAIDKNFKVLGFRKGYEGLISGDIVDLEGKKVTDIMQRGGTILHTARSEEMLTKKGQEKAAGVYKVLGLNSLVVIGGDGSFKGADALSKLGVNATCIPATIDLDMDCTDYTIGFDTAVNTGIEAINKLRDTSTSHERCSVVEVMGRNAGYIALWCGIGGGAEEVLIPEKDRLSSDSIIEMILLNRSRGKKHNLIIVAEGVGKTKELADEIQQVTGIETRYTILGHLQRGGSPSALDRVRASVMGYKAVELIEKGIKNRIIVFKNGEYSDVSIEDGIAAKKEYNDELYEIIKHLAI